MHGSTTLAAAICPPLPETLEQRPPRSSPAYCPLAASFLEWAEALCQLERYAEALSLSTAAIATQPQEALVAYEQALALDARLVLELAGKACALRVLGQDGAALAA